MSLNIHFKHSIKRGIEGNHNDLLNHREILVLYKDKGMSKEAMINNLEELRGEYDSETEDIILELMDFVTGYCDLKLWILLQDIAI